MAIAKIEPTGCCVYKGKVQLRFNFYLEPGEPRYKEHYIQVPIIPEEGYIGEVDTEGYPVDMEGYNNWLESLPKKWQNNPFHNHFVYVAASSTDNEIRQLLTESLVEFLGIWGTKKNILDVWKPKGRFVAGDMSSQNINNCHLKANYIKTNALIFQVTYKES